ncbi:glycosyl transferase [Aliidongia dinghuensis]|uniref:Glycosyl transferase n=1 Tax=Aliidongia dinghuensis TaxID=1867774 RepID=A0A8J3E4V5_9PROT|nr:glycosyl transferase [Aliidongia dinghuensis]
MNRQDFKDFEVIVVDQNSDDRLVEILGDRKWQFPVTHLRTPTARGASRARNNGWRVARGEIITFPDDDCWYPPWILSKALGILERTGADMVTGRAADLTGRSINARFEMSPQIISLRNLWSTHIEWVAFFRRTAFEMIGGYDEDIGPGAASPWQACEAQDVSLRALKLKLRCYFDPSLYAHHKEAVVTNPDETVTRKQRGYARGMGYVLRKHEFGPFHLLYWIARPVGGMLYYFLQNKRNRAKYSANVVMGRVEGWLKVRPKSP